MEKQDLINFRKRLNADLEALSGKLRRSKYRKQATMIIIEIQQINRLIKKIENNV